MKKDFFCFVSGYHLLFLCLTLTRVCSLPCTKPLLIVISMDGFRHDYLELHQLTKNDTPNFYHFIEEGVRAREVMNVWPANTYPNHMTILTGTYPETHGLVNNYFYDPILEDSFNMTSKTQNLYASEFFDNGAEPIWVTNDKHDPGRRTGSLLWPAGLTAVKCIKPRVSPNKFWTVSLSDYSYKTMLDDLIDWFTDSVKPINLGLVHFDEPDDVGHKYGPNSKEVRDIIITLDQQLGYLRKQLEKHDLTDRMNIIITADHGMTAINKVIDIDNILQRKWYTLMGSKLNAVNPMLQPKPEYEQQVITALFGKDHGNPINGKEHDLFYAWMKDGDEMKKRHYSNNRRIMKIILEAKKGYIFGYSSNMNTSAATHGYDPVKTPDMRPFFIAAGPAFKKGVEVNMINMVDIYPMMCHILGLDPAPNNGSLGNVMNLLSESYVWHIPYKISVILAGALVLFIGVIFALTVVVRYCKQKQRRKMNNRAAKMAHLLPEKDAMLHSIDSGEDDDDYEEEREHDDLR